MNAAGAFGNEAPAPYWKCVVAALPALLVGAQFLEFAVSRRTFLGLGARDLTLLMQVEFLVIHSMGFLGVLGLWKPADAKGALVRAIVFWGLFALYLAVALSQGRNYFLTFFAMTFATYLGVFLNWQSPTAMLQLGMRWAVGFIVFLLAVGLLDTPKNVDRWKGNLSVIEAGTFYFLGLAAIELTGFYLRVIPRHSTAMLAALRKDSRTGRP